MSTKTVFECDNIFSDANPHGEVHGNYHYPRLLESTTDPVKDGWFEADVDGGVLGASKVESSTVRDTHQKHFCCWDCMISWAKREMNPKGGE